MPYVTFLPVVLPQHTSFDLWSWGLSDQQRWKKCINIYIFIYLVIGDQSGSVRTPLDKLKSPCSSVWFFLNCPLTGGGAHRFMLLLLVVCSPLSTPCTASSASPVLVFLLHSPDELSPLVLPHASSSCCEWYCQEEQTQSFQWKLFWKALVLAYSVLKEDH